MASEPVRSTAVVAAPKDYSIPPAQQIRLLSVLADFDGSGSAADWLPALQILDNNGNVLITAADPAVSVAAGGSATVSWFPGVKVAAAAATSSGAAWFFASRFTSFTVATTTPIRRIPFTHTATSDATVFTTSADTHGDTKVTGNKAGIYLATLNVVWQPNQTYPASCAIITDFFGISHGTGTDLAAATTAVNSVGVTRNVDDFMLAITNAVPGEISAQVHNWDGANHNVVSVEYFVSYWPNSTLVT